MVVIIRKKKCEVEWIMEGGGGCDPIEGLEALNFVVCPVGQITAFTSQLIIWLLAMTSACGSHHNIDKKEPHFLNNVCKIEKSF